MKLKTLIRLKRRRKKTKIREFEQCIADLFQTDSVQEMRNLKHHLNLSCLDHSLFVSYTGYRLCKFFKWDYASAARGGLLHDLFLYDWREKDTHQGLHGFSHPKAALENAEKLSDENPDFKLSDLEKDMILNHMWPLTSDKPAHKESMLICIVDKLCALAEMTLIFQLINFKSKYFQMASQGA